MPLLVAMVGAALGNDSGGCVSTTACPRGIPVTQLIAEVKQALASGEIK